MAHRGGPPRDSVIYRPCRTPPPDTEDCLTEIRAKVPAVPSVDVRDLVRRARSRRLALLGTVLAAHHDEVPTAQATVDLFAREWASRLPPPLDGVRAGMVPLFEDDRIAWAIEAIGGVDGLSVLELGPLEGGHTFMLQRAGAASIVAI